MSAALDFLSEPLVVSALGVVAVTTAYMMSQSAKGKQIPPVDLKKQSIELPGDERIHVSPLVKDGKYMEYKYEDVRTVYEGFMHGMKYDENADCMGQCTDTGVNWLSFKEVYEKAKRLGSGLIAKGLQPGKETLVGIYAQNRLEWGLIETGCLIYSLVSVPLYDTLGPDICTFIINQGEIETVVADTSKRILALLERAADTKTLQRVVAMLPAEVTQEVKDKAKETGVDIILITDLEEIGKENLKEPVPPKPDDLYTICYTSGTTGNPKGAMLSHGNMIASSVGVQVMSEQPSMKFKPGITLLSYLPLAHLYERLNEILVTMHGGRIAYYRGDVKLIMDDLANVKPMGFPSVPRLLNRVYDKVMQGVESSSWIKRKMFYYALKSKKADLEKGIIRNDTIWDKLVFSKIQERMGGQIEIMFSGAAPLSPETMTFLRCAVGCPVLEGYGQTESGVISTITLPGDHTAGHVGPPLPCNGIKLVDVPEMEYFAKDDKGEICFKGPNVFKGYWKDPEKTKEAVDEDGWLHSGDIGQWLPNGTLKIIDRRKHIFKLAQGEYLAPEKIENVYLQSTFIEQMWVHGDSLQSFAVGVVVPDREILEPWAKKQQIQGDFPALCKHKKVKEAILKDITEKGKKGGLKSFEQVKDIFIFEEPFSVDNGLMTPTFKIKRPALKKKFQKEIQDMYAAGAKNVI
ncbi:Long-chain-fatty-acid--CoA ligase 1 [Holothuria leucospilota]|uniref:Long-chain-fatty-acid--CoA ligase n=1 Tax=Holothuria leucospilota TaxID=206669 RepID=A0A9Q0YHY8_HOLLE|nr:Long-chain-fatty-acid--CoA ligase 1 [Holothuria leucospilota]